MRKFIATILALVVLVLSCIPCDEIDALPISQQTAASIKAAPSHENGEHHIDICSPFCSCACCAGLIITSYSYTIPAKIVFHETAYNDFVKPIHPQYVPFLWQPPDLV